VESRTQCPRCHQENPPEARFCQLVWGWSRGHPASPRFSSPGSYIPKLLAEKILTSRAALEGERKYVTVLLRALVAPLRLRSSPARPGTAAYPLRHHARNRPPGLLSIGDRFPVRLVDAIDVWNRERGNRMALGVQDREGYRDNSAHLKAFDGFQRRARLSLPMPPGDAQASNS
jgi:hypothetical protein